MNWYSVRSIVEHDPELVADNDGLHLYEERIVLFQAESLSHAIEQAEVETAEYSSVLSGDDLEKYKAFFLCESRGYFGESATGEPIEELTLTSHVEVFSLMRTSKLGPEEYLNTFFDTGNENQGTVE
jgi:hypothetical protein